MVKCHLQLLSMLSLEFDGHFAGLVEPGFIIQVNGTGYAFGLQLVCCQC